MTPMESSESLSMESKRNIWQRCAGDMGRLAVASIRSRLMEVNLVDETLCATWLIDVTGRRASVARRLGLKREILDQMVAIHRTPTAANGADQDGLLFLEALPHGWWYSVLIPSRRRVFSFQTDADLLPARG